MQVRVLAVIGMLGLTAWGQAALRVGEGNGAFRTRVFASGLSRPYGMTALPDGSLLVCTTDTSTSGGDYLSGKGALTRLADPGRTGTATVVNTVFSGFPYPAQGVRLIGDRLVAVSLAGTGRTQIVFLRVGEDPSQPYTQVGLLELRGPVGTLMHFTTMETRPVGAGAWELYFSIADGASAGTVTASGLAAGTMELGAVGVVTVRPTAGAPELSGLRQVAGGLRNPGGIAYHAATGQIYVNDNGADRPGHTEGSLNADELNRMVAGAAGVAAFGWPQSYTEYETGTLVGNAALAPLVAFQPFGGKESLGAAEMAVAPAGFPAGWNDGLLVAFYGKWEQAGAGNLTGPLLYYDFGTGQRRVLVEAGHEGVGHPASVLTAGDGVYVADMSATGKIRSGEAAGVIYRIESACASASVSPAATAAPAAGTALSATVTADAGCAWTAAANAPWLTVTAGGTGTGNGTVSYAVAGNGGTAGRTATLTVAGRTVTVTQGGPTAAATGPVAGTGTAATLTFTFTHPEGWDRLDVVNVLINQYLDGDRACYLAYSRPGGVLYVVKDGGPGSGLSAGLTPGAAGTVGNSQCRVNGAGTTVSGSGNTLTLRVSLEFLSGFTGSKVIYTAARDVAGGNSGWFTQGAWTVPGGTVSYPRAAGATPATGTGAEALVQYAFDDATAAGNLQTVWVLANTAIDGRRACYVAYSVPGNRLYLFPDNGDGTQAASVEMTGTNQLENGQCRVLAEGSTVTKSGQRLTLGLRVEWKGGFGGPRGIWTAAQTTGGQVSGWVAAGNWVVP